MMRRLLKNGPELLQIQEQTPKPAKQSREERRTTLFMHYALPSENLPMLARVGVADVAMFAFRCGACSKDFHIGFKPQFCPSCGIKFETEREFGGVL